MTTTPESWEQQLHDAAHAIPDTDAIDDLGDTEGQTDGITNDEDVRALRRMHDETRVEVELLRGELEKAEKKLQRAWIFPPEWWEDIRRVLAYISTGATTWDGIARMLGERYPTSPPPTPHPTRPPSPTAPAPTTARRTDHARAQRRRDRDAGAGPHRLVAHLRHAGTVERDRAAAPARAGRGSAGVREARRWSSR